MSPAPVHIHTHGRAAGVCILSRLPELLFPNFAVAEKPPVTAHLPKFMCVFFFQVYLQLAFCIAMQQQTPDTKENIKFPNLAAPKLEIRHKPNES